MMFAQNLFYKKNFWFKKKKKERNKGMKGTEAWEQTGEPGGLVVGIPLHL